jgi:hypothetical protein
MREMKRKFNSEIWWKEALARQRSKYVVGLWTRLMWLRRGSTAGSCEPLGSTKGREFLDQLSNC